MIQRTIAICSNQSPRSLLIAAVALAAALGSCSSGDSDSESSSTNSATNQEQDGGGSGSNDASSNGSSGGASDDSGASETGGTTGGETTGDANSGQTQGGNSEGGSGGPGEVPECETNGGADQCAEEGALCAGNDICCRCIRFVETPSCGLLWECARLDLNSDDCPDSPPQLETACDIDKLNCSYCSNSGPVLVRCSRLSGEDAPSWRERDGIACDE